MMKTPQREFTVIRKNAPRGVLSDNYHRLLGIKWRYLISLAFIAYLGINLIFAGLFYLLRDGLSPKGADFLTCFFFSVHTFSTVGYGHVFPEGLAVSVLTVLETFTGLVSVALVTGLFFAKFSRPSAKFLFVNRILVTQHQGRPAILFRVANARSNRIMDAELSFTALFSETTTEGVVYRRFINLELERPHSPVFALTMTGIHHYSEGSFTHSLIERLKAGENIEFLIAVRGLDDTFGQTIHDTRTYRPESIVFGGQYHDVVELKRDGTRIIDFANFQKLKGEA